MYINGHFCYADKLGIITHELGIIRHIAFFDEPFKEQHPNLIIEEKFDSLDEEKSIGDASTLKSVLQDFFSFNPSFNPNPFLGHILMKISSFVCSWYPKGFGCLDIPL